MPSARSFPNTPSGGRVEARALLLRAGARRDRPRPLFVLERFLPPRARAALQGVLDTLVGEGDVANPSGDEYVLTDSGLVAARQRPNPPHLAAQPRRT